MTDSRAVCEPSHDFEVTVASLLASVLRREQLWQQLEAASRSRRDRDQLAVAAAEIYSETAVLASELIDDDTLTPTVYALGILRDIGDACALTATTPVEIGRRAVPTRAVIELEIRLYEVERWAEALGIALDLHCDRDRVPPEAWMDEEAAERFSDAGFATQFVASIEGYDRFRRLLENERAIDTLRSEEFRTAAASDISSARGWTGWARRNLPTGVHPAAAAMVYMAQGCFSATILEIGPNELFPTNAFLRDLVGSSPAYAWLTTQGANLPGWLNPECDHACDD
jgi:hypothetical protein